MIINEAMARRFWPGGDPVGARIAITDVRPTGACGLRLSASSATYDRWGSMLRRGRKSTFLIARSTTSPGSPLATLSCDGERPDGDRHAAKQVVHQADPTIAVSNVRTLDEVLDEDVASRRIGHMLLAAFAGFALSLAVVGIYGVIAYFVAQHVPEMGVRIALGASSADIVRLIVIKGLKLALAGIAIGTVAGV